MAKAELQTLVAEQKILNRIHVIRGQKVMLDRDLAEMYGVETRRLNEQVKRNSKRFPEDFMFTLTRKEFEHLMSQIATSSLPGNWGGTRKLPNAFTEQGVAMLSSILNSDTAIAVNIRIIRVFTKLRQVLLTNQEILLKLEQLDKKLINMDHDVSMHDGEIETLFTLVKEIMQEKIQPGTPRNPIGFNIKPGNRQQ